MGDINKIKKQPIEELAALHQRVVELEGSEEKHQRDNVHHRGCDR